LILFSGQFRPIPQAVQISLRSLKPIPIKNSAAHELAHKLSQAKDLQDVVRIQTEFMQMQLNAFGEQAKSLGEEFTKIATGVMKTPFKSS
jgi:hypothetical protein